jgi:drug/metabolite transporter (DMT)-like permease
MTAYILALSSVLTFSTAAIGFTYFSQKVSALWMNLFKAVISLIFSVPIIFYMRGDLSVSLEHWPFLVSGVIGLNVADWMILGAYKTMGPARTLIVYGFQPFIVGSFSYFVWEEELFPLQFLAILFFVICLFLFSYERFKAKGQWEVEGLLLAFGGVVLDSIGIILTRHGFNLNPALNGFDAQYIRTLAAVLSFVVYYPFIPVNFFKGLARLTLKERGIAVLASFSGTFLSLVLYLQALKHGKLATVTSIVLTDPVMSTFCECLWLKLWPSRYLWMALASFFAAMFCLFYPQWT